MADGTKTDAPDAVNVQWSWTAGFASAKQTALKKNTTSGKKGGGLNDSAYCERSVRFR